MVHDSFPTVPYILPESTWKYLPPINFRPLLQMHHPVYPFFTLPNLPGIAYFIIGMTYNIALVLFAFLPIIFIVKKWKPITWWKAFLAIFLTAFLFLYVVWGMDDALAISFGSYIGNVDYLTDNYMGGIALPGGPLLTILLALSPFYWVKKIYPAAAGQASYTWPRFFLALFFCAILLALGFFFWYNLFFIGLGAWANYMNG